MTVLVVLETTVIVDDVVVKFEMIVLFLEKGNRSEKALNSIYRK